MSTLICCSISFFLRHLIVQLESKPTAFGENVGASYGDSLLVAFIKCVITVLHLLPLQRCCINVIYALLKSDVISESGFSQGFFALLSC